MTDRLIRTALFLSCALGAAALFGGGVAAEWGPRPLSPLAIVSSSDGAFLYIAEHTANQVAVFDVAQGEVVRTIAVPGAPGGLALSADGARLYVSGGGAQGAIYAVDPAAGCVVGALPVGHTPVAPVLSPDGGTLYVCNRFNNDISVINVQTGSEVGRIPAGREPIAAAITPDGGRLVVANHLPGGASDGDYTAATVSIIDTAAMAVSATIQLPNGSSGLRGLCLSPDGKYAYVTHILGRYHLPTTQLERGWMNTNALTVIDTASQTAVNTVLLDSVDLGAANPWGVACSADGVYLCVAHAGTHEVSVIDRAALHAKLDKVAAGEQVTEVSALPEDVPNDLAFLVDVRRRLKLAGKGPRGLVVLGTEVYAAEYFTDSLGLVDIDPEVVPRPKSLALGPDVPSTVLRTGERLFNDATLCFQQWQSCASCHPGVRADGLNWDLLNDGMGNPKNTKSLLLAHQTPPAMATGVRDNAESAVRSGIRYIQFVVRPEEDAVAIDQYLKSLEPVPSPHLVNGEISEAARRGQHVFEEAGCAVCHPAPLYTDLQKYNVGTGKDREQDLEFDTPTLVEVWRTGPYLHDGRASTVRSVFREHNPGDRHGATSGLTDSQLDDLAAYVNSL